MSNIKHGRANHDPISMCPECFCGARGVKDTTWDRYYCPNDGVWLEGTWAQCWCPDCLNKPQISEEDECVNSPINSW